MERSNIGVNYANKTGFSAELATTRAANCPLRTELVPARPVQAGGIVVNQDQDDQIKC